MAKYIAEQFPLPALSTSSEEHSPSISSPAVLKQDHDLPDHDLEMARQLTTQYQRAIGGMRDVLLFGAMMIKLTQTFSARGKGSGNGVRGGGVKGWLSHYAPSIRLPTAYRFMAVAEAVQESFKIPAKAQKTLGFAGFVTANPEDLPESLQKKQLELFEFVDGTSQRSWLDRLRPAKAKGGAITRREEDPSDQPPMSEEEKAQAQAQVYYGNLYLELYKARTGKTQDLLHLPYATDTPADEASLVTLLEELELLTDQVREVIEQKRA